MWTQFQASHRTHISAHSSALHKALVLTPQVDGINDLYQGEVVDVERKFQVRCADSSIKGKREEQKKALDSYHLHILFFHHFFPTLQIL